MKIQSNVQPIHRLVHHMSETEDNGQVLIPKVVVFLNVCFRPVIGAAGGIRGSYDGKLSIVALLLSIVYFVAFGVVIYFDDRFEPPERWARLLPKMFGTVIAGVQMIGVVPIYLCNTNVDWRTCV